MYILERARVRNDKKIRFFFAQIFEAMDKQTPSERLVVIHNVSCPVVTVAVSGMLPVSTAVN